MAAFSDFGEAVLGDRKGPFNREPRMRRLTACLLIAAASSGCAMAKPDGPPEMRPDHVMLHAIETFELVCKDDRPTIVATATARTGGWSGATAVFPGGPPNARGELGYDAVAIPPAPDMVVTQALTTMEIEAEAVITKGTTSIALRSETNEIVRPHPPGC